MLTFLLFLASLFDSGHTRARKALAARPIAVPRSRIVGYRRNGAPVWSIGGADPQGDTLAALEQERTDLLARLDNPGADDKMDELIAKASDLTGRIDAANKASTARAALAGSTVVRVAGTSTPPPAPAGQPTGTPAPQPSEERVETFGRAFIRSAREQAEAEGISLAERVGQATSRSPITVPGEVRALFATTNNPVNFPRVPGYVIQNDQMLEVIDLVDRQPMTSTSIEWVQETAAPNAAVEVTEGSAKPEATFTLTLVTDTAATIAHYVNLSRQALADDLQLRGYVEGRLSYGLMKRVNGQIINGNGTAPNLRGILNTSGIGTYTAGTATEAAILSVRKAKTVAELSEYEPDSVVMNPVDWEAVELSADSTGQWRFANPSAGGPPRVWGLAVVSTTAITGTVFGTTGGTFLVGAFRAGATLWERTGVDLYLTDSHASNFTSNILTLLAEIRAALSVWRPKAFVKGTFGASRT